MKMHPFAVMASLFAASSALASTTTFSTGTNGWGVFHGNDGTLGDFERPTGGNPDAHLEFIMVDTFGASLHNDSNADVLGDYSRFGNTVTFGVDVKAESITFFGTEVERHVVVELVDNNPPGSNYPYTSVWYDLGTISAAQGTWQKLGVSVDPTSSTIPAGWGGYGDEDPITFEPILPANRTFASVLASVDEVRFTTFVPGFFYGFTNFDLRYDNVVVGAGPVPEPASLTALGALMLLKRRR